MRAFCRCERGLEDRCVDANVEGLVWRGWCEKTEIKKGKYLSPLASKPSIDIIIIIIVLIIIIIVFLIIFLIIISFYFYYYARAIYYFIARTLASQLLETMH